MLLAAVAAGRGPAAAPLPLAPLVRVRIVSYGVYPWRVPLIPVSVRLGVLPHEFGLRLAAVALLTTGIATLSSLPMERTFLERAERPSRPSLRAARRHLPAALGARTAPLAAVDGFKTVRR